MKVIVFILAGGKGERFWPRSNRKNPKQLQEIYSPKTLLEETIGRASLLTSTEHIFIGCNAELKKIIRKKHPEISRNAFIVEPEGRNTAPMIAQAALEFSGRFPDAIHVVMPADHYISPPQDFHDTLQDAIQAAQQDLLVTLGVVPQRPDSQYGYIQAGDPICQNSPARHIQAFKEKPDLETAKSYLAQGNYYWNSGIFIWSAKTILNEFRTHASDIIQPLQASLSCRQESFVKAFAKVPKLSVDIAVLEKSSKMAVVPARFQWDDLGSWNSLERILVPDSNGNYLFSRKASQITGLDSTNNIIAVDDHLIALLGIQNIAVVQEGKTLFIAHRNSLDDIKKFLGQMHKNPSLQKYVE